MAGLRGRALIAYLLVCVVWGSTYLAIRIGVADLPPFLFAGARFFTAGILLGGAVLATGGQLPRTAREWKILAIGGTFLLVGGNAIVVWAEQTMPSGLASVYVAAGPLWTALFDSLVPGGKTRLWASSVSACSPACRQASSFPPRCVGRSRSRSRPRPGRWGRSTPSGTRRVSPPIPIARRLHRLRVRAAPCFPDYRGDLCLCEPGRGRPARLAGPARAGHGTHTDRDGGDSGRGALDPALVLARHQDGREPDGKA
jgi:hypothetical protein